MPLSVSLSCTSWVIPSMAYPGICNRNFGRLTSKHNFSLHARARRCPCMVMAVQVCRIICCLCTDAIGPCAQHAK
jgi:hypothetical protein